MDKLSVAVTDLVVATSAGSTIQEAHSGLMSVLEAAQDAETEQISSALGRLGDVISDAPVAHASLISVGCGALVERGGTPDAAIGAILERLTNVMERTLAFALSCEKAAKADPAFKEDEEESEPTTRLTAFSQFDVGQYVRRYGEQVAANDPQGAICWRAIEQMGMGAIAMLTRSPEARAKARAIPALAAIARDLAAFHGTATFLQKLFHVLDDEIVQVIHVPQQRGYRLRIGGIADNFQLHVLLADTLVGDGDKGLLVGKHPDPRVVAAAKDHALEEGTPPASGAFNLVNWTGLQTDGTLPKGHADFAHWIWNEGTPSDIRLFDGIRVVLLTDAPYSRSWNPGRCFPNMPGKMRLLEILQPQDVWQWIQKMATAQRSG